MMKNILPLILLLCVFAITGHATDVTVSALALNGFNPTNIGNDRSIIVTTAGGSPTVTSVGAFPSSIVGIGGFTVLIDGTTYTVAGVSSTSSLTLTTNYSGTPGVQTMLLYKYVFMRVYADRAFQPLGSFQVVQPGTVGSGSFYIRFAASVVNTGSQNQLFIPQFIIPATTDALITNQAKYTFALYRTDGSTLPFFVCPNGITKMAIPPSTPTTWAAICQYNSPSAVVPPNNEAYTKTEIDFRFPSCSVNQSIYYASSGNTQACLTYGSGLTLTGGTLTAGGGGSGYNRIQEEGSNLTQRLTLNFVGSSFTAADDAGNTRTNVTSDSDLDALAANVTNGLWARTGTGTGAARTLTAPAAGLTITNPAGTAGNPTFALANDLAALEGLSTSGFSARIGTDSWAVRTLTAPAAGFTITNPAGIAGNPTFVLSDDLGALEALGTTGIAARTGTSTWANRTLTGTGNRITVTNGDGVAGNPVFDIGSDVVTLTGSQTLTNKTLTSPAITGALPLSIDNTASIFNLIFASSETLTANRTLTFNVNNTNSSVTFPSTGTLATLDGTETLTAKTLSSPTLNTPRIVTSISDTNGNELAVLTATASAVNEITLANATTGNPPSITASGNDANINLNLRAKGTGRLSLPGYPFTLASDNTSVGNVGAGLDNLQSVSIPAGSLATNGDWLVIKASGNNLAGGSVNRRYVISFGGQTIRDTGSVTINTVNFNADFIILRLTSTTVRVSGMMQLGDIIQEAGSDFYISPLNVDLTVADLGANTLTLLFQGEHVGGATNNVAAMSLSVVELVQR